ncbi:YopX family protein [Cytobacillus kochii]
MYSDHITAFLDEKTLLVFGCGEWNKHEVEKVEFSTGLTDKKGKESYEGDILAYIGLDGRNLNLVVKWSERDATFLFDGVRTDYAITGEVSGSIYENPELINS